MVIDRRANEQPSASRQNGAAVVLRTGVRHSFRDKLGVLAERNPPEVFPCIQVDCIEGSPGRNDGRIAVGIEELSIAGEVIFGSGRGGVAGELPSSASGRC